MSLSLASTIALNSGYAMPRFGLGVYENNGKTCYDAVLAALRAGYKLIDTAEWYGNEKETGQAVRDYLKESGTPRSDIFYVTKLMTNSTESHAANTIQKSLKASGLDYIDLYLIHSPYPNKKARLASWIAMQTAQSQGLIKSLGVSNYGIRHIQELMSFSDLKIKPAVNQIDLHPFMQREEDVAFCRKQDIALMAWAPLARGYRFDNPTLASIAKKKSKTPAQVLLRWGLQKDYIVIPKSVSPQRIQANAQMFDFELSEEEMKQLEGLEEYLVTDWDPIGDKSV